MTDINSNEIGQQRQEEGGWVCLPDILLERIFGLLPPRYLARTSQVCLNWNRIFHSKRPWHTFIYHEQMFTRRKFTLHAGYQRFLDYWKVRFLINKTGHKWRHLVFKPVSVGEDLANLYEFVRTLSNFADYYAQQNEQIFCAIRAFEFNWRLLYYHESHRKHSDTGNAAQAPTAYGTGGTVLNGLRALLAHMGSLQYLALRQLQLDDEEADEFLGFLLETFSESLRSLCIRNLTKSANKPFFHLGLFLNLYKLVVSPQHVNDDVVSLLSANMRLQYLVLIQDENTAEGVQSVSAAAWHQFRHAAPHATVHLKITGRCAQPLVWQPSAPVASIAYDTPYAQLTVQTALIIIDNYADTLTAFVQHGLQRRYRARQFHERVDCALVMLARECPRLTVLAIRERLSTATALYVAALVSHRRAQSPDTSSCSSSDHFWLCIRRNALLKRRDWPRAPDWTQRFAVWLRAVAKDYDLTQTNVGQLLGNRSWTPLTDNHYMRLFPNFKI